MFKILSKKLIHLKYIIKESKYTNNHVVNLMYDMLRKLQ